MKHWTEEELETLVFMKNCGLTWSEINPEFPGETQNSLRKTYYRHIRKEPVNNVGPKVLLLDIETLPMEAYVWGLFDQNIGLEMVKTDWSILSFSAKWLGAPENEVMYYDTRDEENVRDDSNLVKIIHGLLDECDVTITQNGIRFDIPKLNARFIKHGLTPPSSYRNIDTMRIAKSKFGFTSNKLAYMTELLCTKYKKLDHSEFSGFKLWSECMKGNLAAFESMKKYNMYDVLSLEELYLIMAPWDKTINFSVFNDEDLSHRCSCGNDQFEESGFVYTNTAKFQRHKCTVCGKEHRDSTNLLSKEKRKSIKR
jgi:uncharacterized protein YprB with RNaseH-like and TPR domain